MEKDAKKIEVKGKTKEKSDLERENQIRLVKSLRNTNIYNKKYIFELSYKDDYLNKNYEISFTSPDSHYNTHAGSFSTSDEYFISIDKNWNYKNFNLFEKCENINEIYKKFSNDDKKMSILIDQFLSQEQISNIYLGNIESIYYLLECFEKFIKTQYLSK